MSNARPNILFLFTDDQRYDTIGALGNRSIQTPNMDRLAESGVSFTQAHIPGGTSGAVCMPSRAMLHTGRSLFHIQGAGESIPEDQITLGETFREQGYITFGTGKWHNRHDAYHRSFSQGDEIFFGGMADHWNMPAFSYDPSGQYADRCALIKDPHRSNEITWRNCDHIHAGRHSTEIISDAAIRFLQTHDEQVPFFCYVSFLAPHDPRTMPQTFLDLYPSEEISLPPNFLGGHPFDNGALHIRDELLAGFPRNPKEIRQHLAAYYAMISHLDFHIGRILDALEEQGMGDNTIVVLAGDNGLAVGQHGLMGKQNCYEHSLRAPLIFSGKGILKNETTEAWVYLYDVFPTLCSLTQTPVPASVEGRDLSRLLKDTSLPGRDQLTFAYTDKHRAIKKDGFKLIEYVVNAEHTRTHLFELQDDPWELNDLSQSPEHAATLADLRKAMAQDSLKNGDRETSWGQTFWAGLP